MGKKYLFVSNVAGLGSAMLPKMFAAEKVVPGARWVFGGGYLNARKNNILTLNVVCNAVSQWNAVALWGPNEVMLDDFLKGNSEEWLEHGGNNTVKELLNGQDQIEVPMMRKLMQNEGMVSWLFRRLRTVFATEDVIFANSGVWLMTDFWRTPRDFAVHARESYWWSPGGGHQFAYNQTDRIVVTTSDHPSMIHGSYFNDPSNEIYGPANDSSFGIQYPGEKPRLFLSTKQKFDHNSQMYLPVIYIIDSENGLEGAL